MVLKLTGLAQSLCTQRPLIVLAEKGVEDFQLTGLDFGTGEHKRSPYTDRQPFGVVPLLEDGDFTLFESRAICRYLASKYQSRGTPLIPEANDAKGWALFEQWASAETANFSSFADAVLAEKIFNPMKGQPTNESVLDRNRQLLEGKLDIFEKILAKQEYMGGQNFSLIDIFWMPNVNTLIRVGEGHPILDRPNLKAWWERVTSRKSWKKVTGA